MRSTLAGLVAAIIIGAIGFIILRSAGLVRLPGRTASPSPSASYEPNFELAPNNIGFPSPSPSGSPEPDASPTTTKGGIVLGETKPTPSPIANTATPAPRTVTTSTSKTITRVNLTIAKTSDCPSSITSEVKDISSSLNVQYRIRDGYAAAITVWNEKGEELAGQKTYTGNGKIVDTGSAKSIKVVIQPNKCTDSDETWLEVFATR